MITSPPAQLDRLIERQRPGHRPTAMAAGCFGGGLPWAGLQLRLMTLGKWAVTTEGDRGGKKTHKSIDSAMIFEISTPDPEEQAEESSQLKMDSEVIRGEASGEAIMVAEVYSAIGSIKRK
ncbi:hypothetical protein QDX81_20905 [Pseudomonas sp. CW003PS]|nr:hypothetical protein QDX81_20905 [Pseudomonas sp. CW003PS]